MRQDIIVKLALTGRWFDSLQVAWWKKEFIESFSSLVPSERNVPSPFNRRVMVSCGPIG